MKKILLFAAILATLPRLFAQTADSISMLPGTALDVFYNFSTGHTDTARNSNWHIAFGVRKAIPPYKTMQAASVRINDGRSVEIYKSNTSISSWSSFDTTGWMSWPTFFNSDSSWDIGALNQDRNLSNPFDYGWGQYNQTSHNVDGTNIWLIAITTSPIPGAPKTLKRLAVQRIVFDTQWVFTLANVDGSDSTTIKINKADYSGKMFAYVNVLSKAVIDREPMLNTWDVVFTRYKALVTLFGQTLMYPVVGLLHNPVVSTAKLEAANAENTAPANTLMFKDNYNMIGWDWKEITTTPGPWPVRDSLAYFVKLGANNYYRIAFTDYYADGSMQYIKFKKANYTVLESTREVGAAITDVKVYPNPASAQVSINASFDMKVNEVNVKVFDITGREVMSKSYSGLNNGFTAQLNTASFNKGMYFISVEANGAVSSQKLIIE